LALIGLWRPCEKSGFECYKQIRVNRPFTLERQTHQADLQSEDFLFLSDDKERLFYFNKNSEDEKDLNFNLVNLDDLSEISEDESKFYQKDVYKMPFDF
jgi:hypothetical protein